MRDHFIAPPAALYMEWTYGGLNADEERLIRDALARGRERLARETVWLEWRDLERICARHGLAFRRPSEFPRNGLLAARIACEYSDHDWCPDFVKAVYRANFEHDEDISDPDVVAKCLRVARADVDDVFERASSDSVKQRLREQTAFAESAGIFGAPSMLVGDELFWGDDRLEQAFEFAAGSG